jgi:Fe2+ transport system protein FeoA
MKKQVDNRKIKNRMNLSELRQGQDARITSVGGDLRLRRRILEMGLNRGAEIHVEKYAPLKDPMEVVVRGNHLSLRVREASEIMVELI